MKASLSKIKKN